MRVRSGVAGVPLAEQCRACHSTLPGCTNEGECARTLARGTGPRLRVISCGLKSKDQSRAPRFATSRTAAHEAAHGREELTRQALPLLAPSKVLRQAQHGQNVRFRARRAEGWPL